MKTIFFLVAVALFIGIPNTNASSSANQSVPCSNFPRKLNGTVIVATASDSGSSQTMRLFFNMDLDIQRVHVEGDLIGLGTASVIVDLKKGKLYLTLFGRCHAIDVGKIPFGMDVIKKTKLEASGVLGMKGTSVDLYSYYYIPLKATGLFTAESGDQCMPVSDSAKHKGGASTAVFLDLKTTVDSDKLKIPHQCKPVPARRSILKQKIKRSFPWISLD
ncbi:hypothetical protein ACROYT_G040575 [Oculina patagonica]